MQVVRDVHGTIEEILHALNTRSTGCQTCHFVFVLETHHPMQPAGDGQCQCLALMVGQLRSAYRKQTRDEPLRPRCVLPGNELGDSVTDDTFPLR